MALNLKAEVLVYSPKLIAFVLFFSPNFRTSLPLVLLLEDTSVELYLWQCTPGSGMTSIVMVTFVQHQLPLPLQLLP